MIKAIIYTSKSGYTKKYAEMLSKRLSLPFYNFNEAKSNVPEGEHVIYLGWVKANHIVGFDRAFKKYVPCCVCAVGISEPSDKVLKNLSGINHTGSVPLFYLQGGFNMKNQSGFNKLIMKMIIAFLSKKSNKTDSEKAMYSAISGGANFVDEKNLDDVINFAVNSQK